MLEYVNAASHGRWPTRFNLIAKLMSGIMQPVLERSKKFRGGKEEPATAASGGLGGREREGEGRKGSKTKA